MPRRWPPSDSDSSEHVAGGGRIAGGLSRASLLVSWRRRSAMVLVLLMVALGAFWLFVVDWLIVREVERRGSEAVGAVVELDVADLSAFPPGIELTGLRITNPTSPMQNALEVRRIAGYINGTALLRGMLVVEELDVEGVRFGTPRASSGALSGASRGGIGAGARDAVAVAAGGFQVPSFEIPKVDDVLAAEELSSVLQIESARAELDSIERRWREQLEALPDQEAFASYEKQLRQVLDDDDLLAGAQGLRELRKQLKRDVGAVRQAAKDLEVDLAAIQLRVREAREAPLADLRRLRDRYGLSAQGAANLSRRLFGEPIDQILQQAVRWSEVFAASLAGDSPESGEVDEQGGALRGFRIRVARISVELERGGIHGVVENITGDPGALDRPLTFAFESDALPGLESLSLTGVLDHRRPEAPADSLVLQLVGYDARGATLSYSPEWPIRVASGLADADATLKLGAAGAMDASARLLLRNAQLAAPFRGDSPLAAPMAAAVEAITELDVRVSVRGTRADYRLEIESNADRALSDAVGGLLRRQTTLFEQELGKRIQAQASGALAELEQSEQLLEEIAGLFGEREGLGLQALDVKPRKLRRQLQKLGLPF